MTVPVRLTSTTTLPAIIVAEFDEMPGMRLTLPQACRLWGLGPADAERVVGRLVERGLLSRDDRGRICRPDDLMS
jgi:hypothetical protein